MEKIEAVFDAGPFMHLQEIDKLGLTCFFKRILTTDEVAKECGGIRLHQLKNVVKKELNHSSKDFAKYIGVVYGVDLGEATAIALCRQEKIRLFFTDDLEAREAAKSVGFEPHGAIAIIVRAFRDGHVTKMEAQQAVEDLYKKSTLFLTKDLLDWTLKEIEGYK